MSNSTHMKAGRRTNRKTAQVWLDAEHVEKLDWLAGHFFTNRIELLNVLIDEEVKHTGAYFYDMRARVLDMRAMHQPREVIRFNGR